MVLGGIALTVASPAQAQDGTSDRAPSTSTERPAEPDAGEESTGEEDTGEPGSGNEDPQTACSSRNTSGTNCQPGNDRLVPGGGDKVSHKGWPAVSGILWISETAGARTYVGTQFNDELLSHHKSDTLIGGAGHDILWGDWDPKNNTTAQNDKLYGDEGNDWLYASHGRNTLQGGEGKDFIYAYYGKGSIDCGPGKQDTAKIRLGTGQYTVKNCERILNFCAYGSIGGKRCAKPGEKKAVRTSRR